MLPSEFASLKSSADTGTAKHVRRFSCCSIVPHGGSTVAVHKAGGALRVRPRAGWRPVCCWRLPQRRPTSVGYGRRSGRAPGSHGCSGLGRQASEVAHCLHRLRYSARPERVTIHPSRRTETRGPDSAAGGCSQAGRHHPSPLRHRPAACPNRASVAPGPLASHHLLRGRPFWPPPCATLPGHAVSHAAGGRPLADPHGDGQSEAAAGRPRQVTAGAATKWPRHGAAVLQPWRSTTHRCPAPLGGDCG